MDFVYISDPEPVKEEALDPWVKHACTNPHAKKKCCETCSQTALLPFCPWWPAEHEKSERLFLCLGEKEEESPRCPSAGSSAGSGRGMSWCIGCFSDLSVVGFWGTVEETFTFFQPFCLQAWSELDTGNRLRSNWDDHFTSSWSVRWLRAVIITKRGEHETSGFSTHHCALHMLTCCFLFLSACNSWTKQKASRIYLWCYSSHCVPGQSPDTVTATSSSWLWSFYLATAFMDQHDDTRGEEKRRGAIWDVSRTISATRTLGALFPLKRSVRRGDSLWLWTKLNCWSQKKDKLLHTHKLFLYSDCDYTIHVQIPKSV